MPLYNPLPFDVYEEGVLVKSRTKLNFIGDDVTATDDEANARVNVTIASGVPDAHKTTHQNGGTDEINVGGLSGLLADDQHIIDAEAVSAMGVKGTGNPLNHDFYVHPNHSGEVTSLADGAQTIATAAVTLAKMADMATASLLGRNTAGVGVPEVLSKATALSLLNVADGADVTGSNAPQAHAASHKSGADVLYVPRTLLWFIPGELTVATEQGATFRLKRAMTVESVDMHVKVAPTDADLEIDILEAGTTIFTTCPEIDATATTEDDNESFSDTALAAGAEITLSITQIGSTLPGEDLTVQLHCKEAVI